MSDKKRVDVSYEEFCHVLIHRAVKEHKPFEVCFDCPSITRIAIDQLLNDGRIVKTEKTIIEYVETLK